MQLQGKHAIVTGGTGVIGSAIVQRFVDEGCHVLVTGRSTEALSHIDQTFRIGSVKTYKADVSKEEDVLSLMAYAQEQFPCVDVLITAAGIYGEIGSVEQCNPNTWMDAIKVNLLGTMMSVKYALPLLKKSSDARIILFAGGGEGAFPNFSSYACSKGAILRLNESLAEELSVYNISVNAMYPGLVNSGFVQSLIAAGPERAGKKKFEEAQHQVEGKEETAGSDIAAECAVFLTSEKSRGLTGKLISARWDNFDSIVQNMEIIMNTDIYTSRRIKPKDRGYDI